jgi:hypothetical protein
MLLLRAQAICAQPGLATVFRNGKTDRGKIPPILEVQSEKASDYSSSCLLQLESCLGNGQVLWTTAPSAMNLTVSTDQLAWR